MTKEKIELKPADEIEDIKSVRIKISDIELDEDNPNEMTKEQLEQLEQAMKYNKNLMDVIVNKQTGKEKPYKLIDGHQRLQILSKNGIKTVLAKIIEVPELQAKLIQQAMNKTRGQHSKEKDAGIYKMIYDAGLATVLTKITPLSMDDIKLSIDRFFESGLSSPGDDDVPPVPKSTKTKTGDIYQLGNHRVMCGDSTNEEHVLKLFSGKKARQLNCDPPYGVDYATKNQMLNKFDKGNSIQFAYEEDKMDTDYREFYGKMLKAAALVLEEPNTVYIWSGSTRFHNVIEALYDNGFYFSIGLVWVKNNQVFGRSDYQPKHEMCAYGWRGKHEFYGGFQTTVLFEDKPQVNELHPTMKPVALIAKTIIHGTKEGQIVYDSYGGSGTTLIACEEHNRICYTIEKLPHYVDVIVNRWEMKTKQKAVKL